MKKILKTILLSSFIISNAFSINVNIVKDIKLKKIPIENHFLSTENGGNKQAIDAYSDGIGIYTTGLDNLSSYSAMNELVFKYGEEAKNNESSLKDFVQNNGNSKEQDLANLLGNNNTNLTEIGATCDDGNANTINDIYIDTNGTCQGTLANVKSSVKCYGEPIGSSIIVDGVSYLVVDSSNSPNGIEYNLHRAETICTSNVTDMAWLFNALSAQSLNPDISNWDTSNVVNMEGMFMNSNFNRDISHWDVSNVKVSRSMFSGGKYSHNLPNFNFEESFSLYGNDIADTISDASFFTQDISSHVIHVCSYLYGETNEYIYKYMLEGVETMNILNYPERLPKIEFIFCGFPGGAF